MKILFLLFLSIIFFKALPLFGFSLCNQLILENKTAIDFVSNNLKYTPYSGVIILRSNQANKFKFDNIKYVDLERAKFVLNSIKESGYMKAKLYDPSGRYDENGVPITNILNFNEIFNLKHIIK